MHTVLVFWGDETKLEVNYNVGCEDETAYPNPDVPGISSKLKQMLLQ